MKIEAQQLALRYSEKPPLFEDLSFQVQPGEFVQISGQSGSGKSSLLRLLNRLQTPTSGRIYLDEKPIDHFEVPVLRRQVAYLQQTPIMVPGSVTDNLLLSYQFRISRVQSQPTTDQLKQLLSDFLLDQVSLSDGAETLSVGQKQRLALIRILLMKPKVLLCDEPTSALDQASKAVVEDQIQHLNQEQQVTVFLVTHTDFKPTGSVQPRRFHLQNAILTEVDV